MKAATPKSVSAKSAAPKAASPKHAASKPATPDAEIRILKVASCSSLSGKSKLGYQVGCTPKSEIQFRVYANSGTGFFSKEWVPLNTIQQAFAKVPTEKTITSFILFPLYRGKSINTPAFLFAALMSEGLVQPSITQRRGYERVAADAFMAKVKALIASAVDIKIDDKPAKAKAVKVQAKSEKTDGKGQDIEPQQQQVADKPQKTDAKPPKVDATPQSIEAKPSKVTEKPLKTEAKPQGVNAKPKAGKAATTPSKKAPVKATPKKNSPR